MSRSPACLLLLCSMTIGCGSGGKQPCSVNDDCTSGFCKLDGTCGPASDMPDASELPDGPSTLCTPDHDGAISAAELPLAAGRMATFRIATDATWDTAGIDNGDGTRRWDLSGPLANEADQDVTLGAPAGMWWESAFAGATYATELASGSDLRGVFAVSADRLELLGVVSPDGGTYRTELEYDGAARILTLPINMNATWSSTSTVSGTASGAVVAYTETYDSTVDAHGTMVTPYGEFPVVRIRTVMTRTSGWSTIASTRTFTWVAECFGPVATATSQSFETDDDFNNPAEVRRLAP